MRLNDRNKQPFYYALYAGTEDSYDEYGNISGNHATYGKPVMAMGNISPGRGSAVTMPFGVDDMYDKVISVEDRDTLIDEYTVLWVDTLPVLKEDGTTDTPWDYIVRRVARGLPKFGMAHIAVSKVSITKGISGGGVSA